MQKQITMEELNKMLPKQDKATCFANAYLEAYHSQSPESDFQAAMNFAVMTACVAAYKQGRRDCIDDAADWIEQYAQGYFYLDHEFQDDPQEIIMSEYCIETFRKDMENE